MDKIRSIYGTNEYGQYTRDELVPCMMVRQRHREAKRERLARLRRVVRVCMTAVVVGMALGVLVWVV